ncbi:MAG TPA: thymidine kinase [Candidatus Enterenecus merdae]|nr:thymidine kinase [Candidatus Enterenecus merdae]
MAKLYFRYGVMGSSKSANALMVRYNYEERGQRALMVKPMLDQREGEQVVNSRIGLRYPCVWFEQLQEMDREEIRAYQCVIVDEAQFLTRDQVRFLTDLVDELDVPVICYGLRADFKGDLFPGSEALLAWSDVIEEVKTICWCGRKAVCNARFDAQGVVLKQGAQVVLGANDCYIGLCRRHWKTGDLGPDGPAGRP